MRMLDSLHLIYSNLKRSRSLVGVLLFVGGVLSTPYLQATDPVSATITQPAGAMTVWAGVPVAFSATTDTTGTFAWNFGDGATGTGSTTTHTFATPPTSPTTYQVTLTVTWVHDICKVHNMDGGCQTWQTVTSTYKATRAITVWAKPVISSFSASSPSVEQGKGTTLSWVTANATSLSLNGTTVTGTSALVTPSGTTTYTLAATNPGGTVTMSTTVTTYAISVNISPGTATLKLGETQAFTGGVNLTPLNQGITWSSTGGGALSGKSNTGATFTATSSGPASVTVTSVESPTHSITANLTVLTVDVPTPTSNALVPGQTFLNVPVTFSTAATGAVNTSVTWSVSGGGTISSSGVFTPTAFGSWSVTARSVADPSKVSPAATLQVVPVALALSASSTVVQTGGVSTLTASVSAGAPNKSVRWSILTANGGSLSTTLPTTQPVTYTAPASGGDFTIQAISEQDGTSSNTLVIHVADWKLHLRKNVLYVGTKELAEVRPGTLPNSTVTEITVVDHLGSPRFSWDGTTFHEQKFLPFGEALSYSSESVAFAKGFTNHEQTDASGLIYMQARFYAPWFGRFLSPDPARDQHFEETQSWNIYSYVMNQPTMQIDPTGMIGDGPGILGLVSSWASSKLEQAKGFVKGFAGQAKSTVAGALEIATRPPNPLPLNTTTTIAQKTTPKMDELAQQGEQLKADVVNFVKKAGGTPEEQGEFQGAIAFHVVLAILTDGLIEGESSGSQVGPAPRTDVPGKASDYVDVTNPGSIKNRATNISRAEFEANLARDGWKQSTSKDGKTTISQKGGAKYVTRDGAKSTGGTSADYTAAGEKKPKLKIRTQG